MPKLGPSAAEIEEEKREALTWGLETRAVRSIVQTYRRALYQGASHLSAFNEATAVALALGLPNDKTIGTTEVAGRGGESTFENLVITCAPCNFGGMERTLDEVGVISSRPAASLSNWDGLSRLSAVFAGSRQAPAL